MRRRTAFSLAAALILCAAFGPGCSEARSAEPPTMVFAAASLSGPFQALAEEFERRRPGVELELHFAGTSQLVMQLREGAPVDVFASADEVNMHRIEVQGLVSTPPTVFATNRLALVVAEDNPKRVRGLADLARTDLSVVLCGPEVPAGRYAREVLSRASVEVRSVSDELSVKAVVSKVQLGEVDVGVVYATDMAGVAGVAAVPIPAQLNVVAAYPIAALSAGRNPATGAEFIAFVRGPAGREILASFGFSVP